MIGIMSTRFTKIQKINNNNLNKDDDIIIIIINTKIKKNISKIITLGNFQNYDQVNKMADEKSIMYRNVS